LAKPRSSGLFCHVELISKDPSKTVRFYETVFAWKVDVPRKGYMFAAAPALPTGGLRAAEDGESPGTLTYIQVEDIESTLRAAEAAGAKILVPRTRCTPRGHYAVILAPGDVPQAIFQA
jgi:predicted enzyme related to lactoylglutathione lyase